MIYKKKWRFWWEFSMLWSIAYMIYTWDFMLELTAKYRKTYKWEFGRNYQNIVDSNIENKKYENLQVYYIGKEGGKHKGKTLIKMFLNLENNYTQEEVEKIYRQEHKSYGLA